jgi:hypothetical protein
MVITIKLVAMVSKSYDSTNLALFENTKGAFRTGHDSLRGKNRQIPKAM